MQKRSSMEVYAVVKPAVMRKLDQTINLPPLLDVLGIPTHQLIDTYETGFHLKSVSNKYGISHTALRVRYPSHYTRSKIYI